VSLKEHDCLQEQILGSHRKRILVTSHTVIAVKPRATYIYFVTVLDAVKSKQVILSLSEFFVKTIIES